MIGAGIRDFIYELERKEFYRYVALFLILFSALLGFLAYLQHQKVTTLEARIKHINKQRGEIRSILQEHALVKKQRAFVDTLLAQEKDFKIGQFFERTVQELGLTQKMNKNPVVDTDLGNGYIESQLESIFKDMDMKQVADLLHTIENNNRIYTKKLELIKPPKATKLDVTLVIATLQPKTS